MGLVMSMNTSNDKKQMTCFFTGHRNLPQDKDEDIKEATKREVIKLINKGVRYFGTGGALGFDTLAAQVVLELKETYPEIKLILVLPCYNQTAKWNYEDVEIYEYIKSRCDKYVYTSKEYDNQCMFKRNRHLVDNSSYCICYMNRQNGGTAYTVKRAKENNLGITNIAALIQ